MATEWKFSFLAFLQCIVKVSPIISILQVIVNKLSSSRNLHLTLPPSVHSYLLIKQFSPHTDKSCSSSEHSSLIFLNLMKGFFIKVNLNASVIMEAFLHTMVRFMFSFKSLFIVIQTIAGDKDAKDSSSMSANMGSNRQKYYHHNSIYKYKKK